METEFPHYGPVAAASLIRLPLPASGNELELCHAVWFTIGLLQPIKKHFQQQPRLRDGGKLG